jgi:hypothetical protein
MQKRFVLIRNPAILGILGFAMWALPGAGAEVDVRNASELRLELGRAGPGTIIRLAPGQYGSGVWIEKLNGVKDKPIVISGLNEQDPPRFTGGNEAFHFADCNYVTLRNIRVAGCAGNGINADDGGSYDSPSRGMVFENITIEEIGPTGNRDGMKLSGLVDFTVRNCLFSGWGGAALDMVGCRDGVIENTRFIGKEGFSQDTGVQAKGGSERVLIRRCAFSNAGQRAINLGGSTGAAYFRPGIVDFEAREIVVAGNHFTGSQAPIAFASSVNCRVRYNTIVNPEKWVLRILQEQPTDRFQACQGGVFENNLIVFDKRVQVFVNTGANTKPETFQFRGNAWFDSQGSRRPALPVAETGGIYQADPDLESAGTAIPKPRSKDARLQTLGAHAYKP